MKNQRYFIISVIFILCMLLFLTKASAQYAKGCDIGWLTQMEASGRKFYDKNGVQKDLLDILKSYDINSIRLRVWVNPANGYCNKTDVISQAVRCKNKGFRILIDFHYSDSWADPGQQTKPAAWTSYTFAQLKQAVATHTNDVLTGLKSAGVYPEWVQVGNETNNGMLWEDGKASVNMNNFAQLITSGYDAVKAVFPVTKVIVHLSNGYDNALFRWMFDGLKNNSAKWDVIGMSLYPEQGIAGQTWQTLDPQCLTNMNDMANRYGKEVILSEVGISWSDANAAYSFIADIMAKNKSVTGGKGGGIFYWEPGCYNGWQGYQKGAFDNSGKPTHAMDAFLEGASTANLEPTVSISSPSTNSTLSTSSAITINVTASDPNGSISKVELYVNGGTRLGSDASNPYSFTWSGAAAGSYVLTAVAYDNSGQIKISSGVTVTLVTGCVPPAAPTVTSPVTYCQGASATVLTANGSSLKWYSAATTGTGSSTAPIPSTTSAGTINHYVSQTVNGCESNRTLITVIVNAIPAAPTATSSLTYCQGATVSALTANGTSLKWYPAATGTGSSTAPMPLTTSSGTQNYYVSQTVSGCESNRTLIAVTVNAPPVAPTVTSPGPYCQGATASALTANGTSLKWYPAPTTGTGSPTAPMPSTTSVGTQNHYVSQTVNGCESSRVLIAVIVDAKPTTATVGANQSTSSSSATLAANTPVIGVGTWTRISGTGTIADIHNPASGVSGLSSGSNSFRWTISNGSCPVSSNDLFIVVGNAPVTQIVNGPDSIGLGSTVSFSVPSYVGSSYNWTIPNGATIQSGQNTNSIQVVFGSTAVTGIIAVAESNVYGSAASQKNVLSGPPPTVANIAGPTVVHEGATSYTYSVPAIPKTNYNWTVPQDAVIVSGQGSNIITVQFPQGTNSGALGVTASNAFGSSVNSIPVTISTIITNTSSMTKYTHVTVAPNPFVDETSIDFHYKKNAGSAMLQVMNMQGEIVYESTEFDINESFTIGKELKSGIYIVVVIYENQSYVRTVVKNQ